MSEPDHTGAPEQEIEVTPEMALAGARILADIFDSAGGLVDEVIATEIFLAVMAKKEI
jgi:hypothetical protein